MLPLSTPPAINEHSSLLAKVHGWLNSLKPGNSRQATRYYSLTLLPSGATRVPAANQTTHQGDKLTLALTSSDRIVDQRWVYVLDIDCHGRGRVLYPRDYAK